MGACVVFVDASCMAMLADTVLRWEGTKRAKQVDTAVVLINIVVLVGELRVMSSLLSFPKLNIIPVAITNDTHKYSREPRLARSDRCIQVKRLNSYNIQLPAAIFMPFKRSTFDDVDWMQPDDGTMVIHSTVPCRPFRLSRAPSAHHSNLH